MPMIFIFISPPHRVPSPQPVEVDNARDGRCAGRVGVGDALDVVLTGTLRGQAQRGCHDGEYSFHVLMDIILDEMGHRGDTVHREVRVPVVFLTVPGVHMTIFE